jgi:Ca2+-binding RTX toxin-like protein
LLSYTTSLIGADVTFSGDDASDVLSFDLDDAGRLRHNRFAAGDSGFASDIDLDTTLPGVQSLLIGLVNSVTVNAAGGDDTIELGSATVPASALVAAFTLNGQADTDVVRVNDSAGTTAVLAMLTASTLDGIGGTWTYITIESLAITLGAGDDWVMINDAVTTQMAIDAGAGNDGFALSDGAELAGSIAGGTGLDRLSYVAYTTAVSVDLGAGEAAKIGGGAAGSISGIEHVIGGSADDTISGGPGDDSLDGGPGKDLLTGASGADQINGGDDDDTLSGGFGNDSLDGGPSGTDRVAESADANFTLADASMTGLDNDSLVSIEEASLSGGAGNNILDAAAFTGPVTLDGGAGNDLLVGGGGSDRVAGGDGNDTLRGGLANDTLVGGLGNDSLDGQAGINTADYHDSSRGVRVNLRKGTARGPGRDRLAAITNVTGSEFKDVFIGDDFANYFWGGFGDDRIQGFGGDDTIHGAAGNDVLKGDLGNDIVLGGAGDDLVFGSLGRDLVGGGAGADRISGESDDDIVIAGSTLYDANDAALRAIMAEWTFGRDYDARVGNLTDGSGGSPVNGSFFLDLSTVHDDETPDRLSGNTGHDWFHARLTPPATDLLIDKQGRESAEPIEPVAP